MLRRWLPALTFFLALCFYSWFSYALTAPNLTLLSWGPYLQFQNWMWETFFNHRPMLTYTFLKVIALVVITYVWLVDSLRKSLTNIFQKSFWVWLGSYLLLISPLFLAMNALSYDVFNYLFNAKMVVVYHSNPHIKVALDFPNDPWVRFMHNTHTPAPYGYGWTAISLVPFELGGGKFLVTWLLFRVMSVISLAWIAWLWWTFTVKEKRSWWPMALVALNPLLLIEVVSTFHNDLWMMAPAVWSLILVRSKNKTSLPLTIASALLLLFSISIKLASLTLVPLWLGIVFAPQLEKLALIKHFSLTKKLISLRSEWWAVWASLLMFFPLLTDRAQQFHPWYLSWVLVWVPFFPVSSNRWLRVWQTIILTFSVSSLMRYIPYLWNGSFTPEIIWQQKLITWIPALVMGLGSLILMKVKNPAK